MDTTRFALFNEQELALAFSRILPQEQALAYAHEWFQLIPAAEDLDSDGRFLWPRQWEVSGEITIPVVVPTVDPLTEADMVPLPASSYHAVLVRFSDLTLDVASLASEQVSERIRRARGQTEDQANRATRRVETLFSIRRH